MSILKDLGVIVGASGVLLGFGFMLDSSAYKRGKAEVERDWQAAEAARTTSELERLSEITSENSAILAAGIEQSAEADRLLADRFASTYRTLENLLDQPIEVGADCRRSYDAVRLYQQAASVASGDRGGEAAATTPGPLDADLPATPAP